MAIVIKVNDVHKKFRLYSDKGASLKERLLFRRRYEYQERWALRGITFEVGSGEAVGIVGENGCGKSTLLKMMTKIMYPDRGNIEIEGRVSSLIELGAGFHPDMSGRENIYINASIFGLSHAEIERRIKDIIDFSEIEEFIDNPVRTYSSGMYMRLAFSVAINVDADVLLIDEILGVGDASFQAKCFGKLREIKANGTTIVIVSHSLGQIEQICDRSIWIDDGLIRMEAAPRDVHPHYLDYMGQKTRENVQETQQETDDTKEPSIIEADPQPDNRWGSKDATIEKVTLMNNAKKETNVFKTGEKMIVEIKYHANGKIKEAVAGIGITRNDGMYCYGTNTHIDRVKEVCLSEKGTILCSIQNELLEGSYTLDVALHAEDGFAYDYWKSCATFRMYSNIKDEGISRLTHQWSINE
jgi:ABC-2 type transport system ATP-binding protein